MIYGVFGLRDVNSILILYRTIYIYTCLLNSMNLSAPAVLIHFTLLRAPYRYSSQLTRTVSKAIFTVDHAIYTQRFVITITEAEKIH